MVNVGKFNTLRVVKILSFGAYLDGGEFGEILMPSKWIPGGVGVDDHVNAFLYYDSSDRIIATTQKPLASVGDFAYLKVKDVNNVGAFLDWGLDKDLMVPFAEQMAKLEKGRSYLVYVFVDPRTKRIVASAKLEKFLELTPSSLKAGDEVDLIIWIRSDLGYKAIINKQNLGMLYLNETFIDVGTGMHVKGFISKVRPDGKIDLRLEPAGYEKIESLSGRLLKVLQDHDGFLPLHDKSPAEEIYQQLGMSKKNFKKSVGSLYRDQLIVIEKEGLRLV